MKLRNGVLVFTLIIFVIAALLVLLTADGEKLNSGAFWLSFVIAIPLNMVLSGCSSFQFPLTPTHTHTHTLQDQ